MEAKWKRFADIRIIPTWPITFKHYINDDDSDEDDDETIVNRDNISFNMENETITVGCEFEQLKEINAKMEKYAITNDLTYEAKFSNCNSKFTFKPFLVRTYMKDGVLVNRPFTQILINDGKDVKILKIRSFSDLIKENFWQDGWNVIYLLGFTAMIHEASKRLILELSCHQILFSKS